LVATLGIFVLPAREDQLRDGIPGVVNADEEQEQRDCCHAEKGFVNV
jgi:hypothetical protein